MVERCEGCGVRWRPYAYRTPEGEVRTGKSACHPGDCSWYIDMMTEYELRKTSRSLDFVMNACGEAPQIEDGK